MKLVQKTSHRRNFYKLKNVTKLKQEKFLGFNSAFSLKKRHFKRINMKHLSSQWHQKVVNHTIMLQWLTPLKGIMPRKSNRILLYSISILRVRMLDICNNSLLLLLLLFTIIMKIIISESYM